MPPGRLPQNSGRICVPSRYGRMVGRERLRMKSRSMRHYKEPCTRLRPRKQSVTPAAGALRFDVDKPSGPIVCAIRARNRELGAARVPLAEVRNACQASAKPLCGRRRPSC